MSQQVLRLPKHPKWPCPAVSALRYIPRHAEDPPPRPRQGPPSRREPVAGARRLRRTPDARAARRAVEADRLGRADTLVGHVAFTVHTVVARAAAAGRRGAGRGLRLDDRHPDRRRRGRRRDPAAGRGRRGAGRGGGRGGEDHGALRRRGPDRHALRADALRRLPGLAHRRGHGARRRPGALHRRRVPAGPGGAGDHRPPAGRRDGGQGSGQFRGAAGAAVRRGAVRPGPAPHPRAPRRTSSRWRRGPGSGSPPAG